MQSPDALTLNPPGQDSIIVQILSPRKMIAPLDASERCGLIGSKCRLKPQYLCRLVDEIVWVKMTVNKRLAKSHGYYLQHAKEVCLVGRRGNIPAKTGRSICTDTIYAERRGQSQKPEEIYHLIEELVPSGKPRSQACL